MFSETVTGVKSWLGLSGQVSAGRRVRRELGFLTFGVLFFVMVSVLFTLFMVGAGPESRMLAVAGVSAGYLGAASFAVMWRMTWKAVGVSDDVRVAGMVFGAGLVLLAAVMAVAVGMN